MLFKVGPNSQGQDQTTFGQKPVKHGRGMGARTRIIFICIGLLIVLIWRAATLSAGKQDELEKLPFGLEVVHTPDKVQAQYEGRSGLAFTWTYKTSVAATNGQVTIQEFGALVWQNEKWVFSNFTGKPFTSQDFADWYSCPGAKLADGQSASDSSNWSGGDLLRGSKTKWYFIGVAADGRRVKGEAIVEELAEVSTK